MKKIKHFFSEWTVIFVLGILMGVVVKTEAVKRITIGFEDQKAFQHEINIKEIEKSFLEKSKKDSQQ